MLAISVMDPTVQGILFLIATVLFVIAALWSYAPAARRGEGAAPGVNFVALGLAFFSFVFMWNAFALS